MENVLKIILIISLYLIGLLGFCGISFAYVMSSSNYRIQSDDASIGGGAGSSVNYIFADTMGEVSSGPATSTSYALRSGYQEMQQTVISISSPGSLTMTPSFGGITGGTANATGTFNVITDNVSGFNMGVKTTGSPPPSLVASGDASYYFSDYSSTPTYNWSVGSGNAQFGFAVSPATAADLAVALRDNGSSCGSGSNAGNCWSGFQGSSNINIINRSSRTDPTSGENEVIKFRAQSNSKFLKSGTYTSAVTVTVSPN